MDREVEAGTGFLLRVHVPSRACRNNGFRGAPSQAIEPCTRSQSAFELCRVLTRRSSGPAGTDFK